MIKINLVGKGASASRIIYLAQTILQFGAAVSSIALNATDISNGPTNTGVSGYAIAAGGLSAITATLFAIDICFPFSSRLWLLGILIWQWVLTLAWTGVVGAFRGRYFDGPTATITAAAGFNLANMLLWLFGSVFGSLSMCLSRRRLNRQKPDESIAMPNYS